MKNLSDETMNAAIVQSGLMSVDIAKPMYAVYLDRAAAALCDVVERLTEKRPSISWARGYVRRVMGEQVSSGHAVKVSHNSWDCYPFYLWAMWKSAEMFRKHVEDGPFSSDLLLEAAYTAESDARQRYHDNAKPFDLPF